MASVIRITITGTPEVMARLRSLTGAGMSRAMVRAMTESMQKVTRNVQLNLTGASLNVKRGRLRQSLIAPTVTPDGSSGALGTNVEYARIHEYGGVTRPHRIAALHAKSLAFRTPGFIGPLRMTAKGRYYKGTDGVSYPRWVNHPGSVMPARPYMRPALQDALPDIRAAFTRAIDSALDGAS